jgi:ribonuclease P/MRP protein subunit POP1
LGKFPHGLIAPVVIVWRPVSDEDKQADGPTSPNPTKTRTLWIRVHPAAFNDTLQTLQQAASRVLADYSDTVESECTIQISDLRTQINTFELSGPQSSRVIWQILSFIEKEKRKDAKQVSVIRDLATT